MNKQGALVLLLALLCCLILVGRTLGGGISSDSYGVPWDARWGGGGLTSSANYTVNGTVGQGVIGWTQSANYGVGTGYWYGVIVQHNIYLPIVLRDAS